MYFRGAGAGGEKTVDGASRESQQTARHSTHMRHGGETESNLESKATLPRADGYRMRAIDARMNTILRDTKNSHKHSHRIAYMPTWSDPGSDRTS